MSKKLLLMFTSFMFAFFLSACGSDGGASQPADSGQSAATGSGPAEAGSGTGETTSLLLWTFVDQHAEYWMQAADLWNEINPDRPIALEASVMPFAEMHQNLQISLTGGTGAPDLVDVEIGQSEMFLNLENPPFHPLNDMFEPFANDVLPSRVEPYTTNGRIWGICYHVGAALMYYNNAVFEEAGLDFDDIVTWDDFVEMGKLVKERTGIWMTQVEGGNQLIFDIMVSQQGVQYIDENGRPNLTDPAVLRAGQFLQDLVYEYEIARIMPGTQMDAEEFYAEANSGNFAALAAPSWYMGRYINVIPDQHQNITVRPLPVFEAGNNRSSSVGGTVTAVTNQVAPEKLDLAREFAIWGKAYYDMAVKQWTFLGFDPIRLDVLEDPVLRDPSSAAIDYFGEHVIDVLKEIYPETAGILTAAKNGFAVRDHLMINYWPILFVDNQMSVEEAFTRAQSELESQLGF